MAEDKVSAPYISYDRFKTFLAKLHGQTIPPVLDSSVYSGYDGSTKSQLRLALRFFGLADAQNRPSKELATVAEAAGDKERWPEVIKDLITARYQGIWAHPLTTTTPPLLEGEFQTEYAMAGNVARKAATFFISAAKEAGIELSPRLTNRPRGGGGSGPRRPRRKDNGSDHGKVVTPVKKPHPAAAMSITAQDLISLPLADMDADLQKAVWSLVLYLKGEEAKAARAVEDDHDDQNEDQT